MKITQLAPKLTQRMLFKLSDVWKIPKMAGCYALTTFDESILYIGLSNNLNRRVQEHLENPEKTNPTSEGTAFWFYFLEYDVTNLEQLERTWLNQFVNMHGRRPVLNKADSPVN